MCRTESLTSYYASHGMLFSFDSGSSRVEMARSKEPVIGEEIRGTKIAFAYHTASPPESNGQASGSAARVRECHHIQCLPLKSDNSHGQN
jgi:hypothetical protein